MIKTLRKKKKEKKTDSLYAAEDTIYQCSEI